MLLMVATRNSCGLIFTEEEAILSLLAASLPTVGLCEIGNCPQTTVCRVLRGSARPDLGAYINLVSFYGVGLPVAVLMGFVLDLGLLAAQVLCAVVMMAVLARTDWKVQADRPRELTGRVNVDSEENNEAMEGLASVMLLN